MRANAAATAAHITALTLAPGRWVSRHRRIASVVPDCVTAVATAADGAHGRNAVVDAVSGAVAMVVDSGFVPGRTRS
ncbi:MAG: hypothetical protein ACK40J_01530 [Rhodococcus sp. (in: high G+C Gram-positive bacteria)]